MTEGELKLKRAHKSLKRLAACDGAKVRRAGSSLNGSKLPRSLGVNAVFCQQSWAKMSDLGRVPRSRSCVSQWRYSHVQQVRIRPLEQHPRAR